MCVTILNSHSLPPKVYTTTFPTEWWLSDATWVMRQNKTLVSGGGRLKFGWYPSTFTADEDFGNSLSNLGTPLAVTIYSMYHHLRPWIRSFDLFRHRCIAIVSWGVHDLLFLEVCSWGRVSGVSLVLFILSRWLIQFCLYLSLTSCIPEISSSFLFDNYCHIRCTVHWTLKIPCTCTLMTNVLRIIKN